MAASLTVLQIFLERAGFNVDNVDSSRTGPDRLI
jgi:hypothetical protein